MAGTKQETPKKKDIILASGSPRRRQLLKMAGLKFSVVPADVPEIVPDDVPPEKESEFLAAVKAGYILSQNHRALRRTCAGKAEG